MFYDKTLAFATNIYSAYQYIFEQCKLKERLKPVLQNFERMGLSIVRYPKEYAGGKMVWRYPSALGNYGNIEVDLNFMYRIPLLPIEYRDSIIMAGKQVKKFQILDIHELSAGKLTALLERQTGRDLFDANELFKYTKIDKNKLRIVFVLYAAMCSKKNLLNFTVDNIIVDHKDLKNKLIPVMRYNFFDDFSSTEKCTNNMIDSVREEFFSLLPFKQSEKEFILSVIKGVGIKPELFMTAPYLIDFNIIKKYPALLWATEKIHLNKISIDK